MPARRRFSVAACLSGVCGSLAAAGAVALISAGAPSAAAVAAHPSTDPLLRSRELWATIDVCNPPKQPDTVGIRGSMPGTGRNGDRMYMSFALQYLNAANQWTALPSSTSSFVAVGGGGSVRQGGWSFTLKPASGHGSFKLRGLVAFKWMRGRHVIAHGSVPTTAGHKALVGAEPSGYSAATCSIS
jgi:hypothetical protein